MIIAIDVHYKNNRARVVSIEFQNWKDVTPSAIHIEEIPETTEYIPGQFYKRELPCILAILEKSDLSKVYAIIVDGYAILDDTGKKGLGGYLFEHLNEQIPIIGVAKKRFHSLNKRTIPIFRGESTKPLYITTIGIDLMECAERIKNMAGEFRMPTLLKNLDVETKNWFGLP